MDRKITAKMKVIFHTMAFCYELDFHVFYSTSVKGFVFCQFSGIILNLGGLIVSNGLVVYYSCSSGQLKKM